MDTHHDGYQVAPEVRITPADIDPEGLKILHEAGFDWDPESLEFQRRQMDHRERHSSATIEYRFLREQNRSIREQAQEMEQIRSKAVPAFQERLLEKLRELLGNSVVDPQRLAQEAAILADRSDIGEEIERLKIHSKQLDDTLDAGGEVGKKLDFLLQEMNRESNTILSKTNGIGPLGLRITELALAAKACIDKIREQALNLE